MITLESNTLDLNNINKLFTSSSDILLPGVSLLYNMPGYVILTGPDPITLPTRTANTAAKMASGLVMPFTVIYGGSRPSSGTKYKVWFSISINASFKKCVTIKVIGHIKKKAMVSLLSRVDDKSIFHKFTNDQVLFTGYVDELSMEKVNNIIVRIIDYILVFVNLNFK